MPSLRLLPAAVGLVFLVGCVAEPPVPEQDPTPPPTGDDDDDTSAPPFCDVAHPDHTVGLRVCALQEDPGYTLFAPMSSTRTWLLDPLGRAVHSWDGSGLPQASVYLLPNGHLLRMTDDPGATFGAQSGGRLEEYDWDGDLVWSFDYSTDRVISHHDVEPLPNGNYVLVAFEKKSTAEATAAGRNPANLSPDGEMHPDHVVEIDPRTDEIVWEWHVWDHLVQSFDADQDNFGSISANPRALNVNVGQLQMGGDWTHVNSVAYNAELDQLMLSSAFMNEFWIIDHGTTTGEAASSSGGRYGVGGDFLYRWGSPAIYADQDLPAHVQTLHDVQWIEPGLPGAGNALVFNNRMGSGPSQVVELALPVGPDGDYALPSAGPWGPDEPVWSYEADDFFSPIVSGAQRLPSGNTLISEGVTGRMFEVTPEGETVWEYINPDVGGTPLRQGETPPVELQGPFGTIYANWIFRAERYPSDYSGLAELGSNETGAQIEGPATD